MTDGTQSQTQQQSENRPWLYKKWQSWNPGWRPKGSISIKTYLQNKFNAMTDEEREEFLEWVNKIDMWRMVEGMPSTHADITSKWKQIIGNTIIFKDFSDEASD